MKISIVSPHRDDACFSLGLSILRWARAGHSIRIVNCFTRSNYAPFSDADTVHANDQTSYVSAMREREDERFLRQVPGSNKVDLRLKDAPIRLRCEVDAVCGLAVNDSDPAIAKIRAALEKRLSLDQVDVLLLPLGVGFHVDHSTVREAALPFADLLPCGFYEDLPYGSRAGAEHEAEELQEQIAARTGLRLTPMICHEGKAAGLSKEKLVRIYSSQIDRETAAAMAETAERYSGERMWANEKLTRMADAGVSGWSTPEPTL